MAGERLQMVGLGTLGLGGCCPKGRKRVLGLILSPDGNEDGPAGVNSRAQRSDQDLKCLLSLVHALVDELKQGRV